MANRAMATKVTRAAREKREVAHLEYSKPCYLAPKAAPVPLHSIGNVTHVNGREVQVIPMGVTRRTRLRAHF